MKVMNTSSKAQVNPHKIKWNIRKYGTRKRHYYLAEFFTPLRTGGIVCFVLSGQNYSIIANESFYLVVLKANSWIKTTTPWEREITVRQRIVPFLVFHSDGIHSRLWEDVWTLGLLGWQEEVTYVSDSTYPHFAATTDGQRCAGLRGSCRFRFWGRRGRRKFSFRRRRRVHAFRRRHCK